MSNLIKSPRDVALGTMYAAEIEKVDIDPRIKKSIYKLANDLHETNKRLQDCIEVTIAFSEALNAIAAEMGVIAARGSVLEKK